MTHPTTTPTRQERGAELATQPDAVRPLDASGTVFHVKSSQPGHAPYTVRRLQFRPTQPWTCTCPDARSGNICKHIYAVQVDLGLVKAEIPHSFVLDQLLTLGGGEIVKSYRGGLGDYWRLEGNELYILPLPIEVGIGADGVKRWYPAAIVPDGGVSAGSRLVPLVNARLCGELNPALRNVCKLRLIIQDTDTPRRSRVTMRTPELGGVA
jgi:hypothetical protein